MDTLKRILLVEDNANDIELTLAALEQSRLANQVEVARDGAAGLDYLFRTGKYATRAEGNPAVVLLDIKMPKMTGLEVLAKVRAEPKMKMLPVVMLTSSREEGDLLLSYQLGVNAYIVKPVDFNRFVEAIKHVGLFWAVLNEPPPGCPAPPN
jgi:CheY-like chemotaxis protein